jgi:PhnB protein
MAAKRKAKKPTKKAAKTSVKKSAKKSVKKAAAKRKAARKSAQVPPVPKGYHTLSPSLCFLDASFAMAFYENAFGAKEVYRLTEPGGKVGHAEMKIGDSRVMLSDEYPEMAVLSAKTLAGSPIRLNLMVKNAEAFMAKAVAAGATIVRSMQEEFYGYRNGVVMDPFGYTWAIMSQVKLISPKKMQDQWSKMLAAHKPEGSAA